MKKVLKFCLILIRSIFIFIIIGAVSTASVKNVQKIVLVEEFKAKGVLQEDISTDYRKFYKIESDEEIPAFLELNNNIYPGYCGDVVCSVQSPLMPIVADIVTFFAGGHAAICMDNYEDNDIYLSKYKSIEATGLEPGENVSRVFSRNYWMDKNYYTEVICMRAKLTEEERDKVISTAGSLLGEPYNFTFLFDTENKTYCSDLISKIYAKVGLDLNKDDFTTSIYDLIISSDVYISFYSYYDSNNVLHIYYLG